MNTKIVVAVLIVGGTGIVKAYSSNPPQPISRVLIGSYVLLLILSIMDLFGGSMSRLAGAFAMLAVITVLLHEFPWQSMISLAQGKKA